MKIGIVVSETYWEDMTKEMLKLAEETAKESEVATEIVKVPGSFDIPFGVKKLLEQGVDGVVTLGALIQGETDHDSLIAYTVASKITDLSLQYNKPVVLGVNGPKMTREQGIARINRTRKVTEACIAMIKTLQ